MCSSEFTYRWHFTVNDLTKLKTFFFIFLLVLNAPLCSPTEDKQTSSNTFKSVGHKSCNQTFQSPFSGVKFGTFTAPKFSDEKNLTEHGHSCVYMFIAQPNEQVSVSFTSFKLRSSPPDCKHEFVDFYTELGDQDSDLKNITFSSRNCGSQLPNQRVSKLTRLAFVYHNHLNENNDTQLPFDGKYEFMKADPFTLMNTKKNECQFHLKSSEQHDGTLVSPTYPGIYNSPLDCVYKFEGENGQRIKIEFHDFDIFFGGNHCPFDFVKIWDGEKIDASPLIGTYCGQRRSFTVFSTRHTLLMQFRSTKRFHKSQNRGFSAWYEFSDRFVNLAFIEKNNGELILGTECDQRIFSKGEQHSNILMSPNFPFDYPSSTQCAYYLYGLHDKFILQKIRIHFEKFDLPNNDPNECSDSSLQIYTADPPTKEADYVFCGTDHPPNNLASDGAIMVLVFKTDNSPKLIGQGFKLQYTFETDYRVQGTPRPPGCHFAYVSSAAKKSNNFNSPRYPASYPAQITCTYEFKPLADEHVLLTFQSFRLYKESKSSGENLLAKSHESNATFDELNGYGDACSQDWLEIYEMRTSAPAYQDDPIENGLRKARSSYLNQSAKNQKLFSLNFDSLIDEQLDGEKTLIHSQEQWVKAQDSDYFSQDYIKLGRWCSRSAPGAIVSSKPGLLLKVVFKTDLTGFASGFNGFYSFKKSSELIGRCNYVIDNETANSTSKLSGTITSPNWPHPYKSVDEWCEWSIKVRTGHRILFSFQSFTIEGDLRLKGCPNAVVRIWKGRNSIPIDLCGDNLTNSTNDILSDYNYMKISFISTMKAVGAAGFKSIWTEVLEDSNQCNQFKCKKSLFCIDTRLRCNSESNCGNDDRSDEEECL